MKIVFLLLITLLSFGSFAETNLSATLLGTLARRGDVQDYRAAWATIAQLPFDERQQQISEVLKAKDSQGNNIFHLMSQHELLAGDMLHLAIIAIEYFEIHDPIDDRNHKGLTPRETALKAKNSPGAEYFVSMENRIKRLRLGGLSPDLPDKNNITHLPPEIVQDLTSKKAMLGTLVLANGILDLLISGGQPLIFAIGALQVYLGGQACQEAWQKMQELSNRSKNKRD